MGSRVVLLRRSIWGTAIFRAVCRRTATQNDGVGCRRCRLSRHGNFGRVSSMVRRSDVEVVSGCFDDLDDDRRGVCDSQRCANIS